MNKAIYILSTIASLLIILCIVLFLEPIVKNHINNPKPEPTPSPTPYVELVTIYSISGDSKTIPKSDLAQYDSELWSNEPFRAVYSASGEMTMIKESQVDAYISNGYTLSRPDWEGLVELKSEIESFLKTQRGSWGVFVQDLSNNEYLCVNEKRYTAASIVKVFTMAATYNEIEAGALQKTDTIKDKLSQMITTSSNEACNYLTKKVGQGSELKGYDAENRLTKSLGCQNTARGSYLVDSSGRKGAYRHHNYTSPRDCGILLKAIYNKELVSETASQEMLDLLLAQTRRWKIPASLPEGTKVANKTGETDTVNSDIAIVFSPAKDYIICVLGNGQKGGLSTIQTVSKMTYEYFNK